MTYEIYIIKSQLFIFVFATSGAVWALECKLKEIMSLTYIIADLLLIF